MALERSGLVVSGFCGLSPVRGGQTASPRYVRRHRRFAPGTGGQGLSGLPGRLRHPAVAGFDARGQGFEMIKQFRVAKDAPGAGFGESVVQFVKVSGSRRENLLRVIPTTEKAPSIRSIVYLIAPRNPKSRFF